MAVASAPLDQGPDRARAAAPEPAVESSEPVTTQAGDSRPVSVGEMSRLLQNAGVRRQAPWEQDFDDLSYEWRRVTAELVGTFFLVLVAAGADMAAAVYGSSVSRGAVVVAPALMVMAVILAIGAVSGAHLNPVVTFAFALRYEFPWRRIPLYLVAQIVGAVVACLFLWAMFGKVGDLGATVPGLHVSGMRAMWMEAVLTCGLVTTILGTASGAQNVGPLSALAVAGYIALAGLWSSPVSGASMNPARSLGPEIVGGHYAYFWVYLAGPAIGMVAAVGIAYLLRGRGRDPAATIAAQGSLSSFLALQAAGQDEATRPGAPKSSRREGRDDGES
jgi:aquaporin Z